MAYNGKTAVVTGAGGFIASHLVEALLKEGAEVRALIKYSSTGTYGHLARTPVPLRDKLHVTLGNVEDARCVRQLIEGADVVFHLAALIGIPYSYYAAHQYVATNVHGTLNILEACKEFHAKLVQTSTSEVYGSPETVPITELHPLQAQSPYAATKIAADQLAMSYHLSFKMPVAIIRPFNTYGPRQSARAIIPTVMSQIASGAPAIKVGNTTPKRDFNYVSDTVAGFLAVGTSEAAVGRVLNVGSGRSISMGDLIRLIFEVTGYKGQLLIDSQRVRPDASEIDELLCDHSGAEQLIGYKPKVDLREGLRRTFEYVRGSMSDFRAGEYAV